jgi:ketosteroid isomerase-like protein
MDGDDSRAIAGRFYASFDAGDVDGCISVFAKDLETTDPGMGTVHGLEPFREYLETLKRAVPDARAVIEALHDAGETVVVEGRFVGAFTGPLATPEGDIPPTGAAVDLRFCDVSRVSRGRIVSYHTYYDQLTLMTQLGIGG